VKTATRLNLWMLGVVAFGRREFPGFAIAPLARSHIDRCVDLGLVVYTRGQRGRPKGAGWFTKRRLALTNDGYTALVDDIAARGAKYLLPKEDSIGHRSAEIHTMNTRMDGSAWEPLRGHRVIDSFDRYAWVASGTVASFIAELAAERQG